MNKEAFHAGILINAPTKIPYTVAEFNRISYIGLASLMVNYPLFIEPKDNGDLVVYMRDYRANNFHGILENHPNPDYRALVPGRIDESAEMGYYTVPKDNSLNARIRKKFSYAILMK